MTTNKYSKEMFWGLCPEVIYRIELGFAFVDDGMRLWKFDECVLKKIPCSKNKENEQSGEKLNNLFLSSPTVFCLYPDLDVAVNSVVSREI